MLNFLLIQNDNVLAIADKPSKLLAIDTLNPKASWLIAVGKDKKVIKPVVIFIAKPGATVYRVTSPIDLHNRLVGRCGNSVEFALSRIDLFESKGHYNSMDTLPIIEFYESNS